MEQNIKYHNFTLDSSEILLKEYCEKKSKSGFIEWGYKNEFPDYLIGLYERSNLHNSIIKLKSNMIGGNGFVPANYKPETIRFIKNAYNNEGMDLESILEASAFDFAMHNCFVWQIRWSKDRTKISDIGYIPVRNVRIIPPEAKGKAETYLICSDWKEYKRSADIAVEYPAFDPENREGATQIYFYSGSKNKASYYPKPDYFSGLMSMETNYHINEFHLSNITRQFAPSVMIILKKIPASIEERNRVIARMEEKWKGSRRAGTSMITFAETDADIPEIRPIESNNSDSRFIELKKDTIDSIVTAHGLTDKSLLGVEIPGELGGKNDRLESLNTFQASYIAPIQRKIEKCFNELAMINGITDKLKIAKYSINLTKTMPINELLAVLQSTLTNRQKIEVMVNNGITREEATLMVESSVDTTKNIN